ncbi:hypothetical protein L1987_53062 [Smallanthus sonchifolius]|uniref:Uncharacterized protein n=1 Tax=Smallanthus sonchifolius TaxID=185202 RepID=A0ACB9EV64_9ASTR|nr:hypothetical protein L1987_53062 [Smallanthus sonchifolius]
MKVGDIYCWQSDITSTPTKMKSLMPNLFNPTLHSSAGFSAASTLDAADRQIISSFGWSHVTADPHLCC